MPAKDDTPSKYKPQTCREVSDGLEYAETLPIANQAPAFAGLKPVTKEALGLWHQKDNCIWYSIIKRIYRWTF